jgi:hypothetical protein
LYVQDVVMLNGRFCSSVSPAQRRFGLERCST